MGYVSCTRMTLKAGTMCVLCLPSDQHKPIKEARPQQIFVNNSLLLGPGRAMDPGPTRVASFATFGLCFRCSFLEQTRRSEGGMNYWHPGQVHLSQGTLGLDQRRASNRRDLTRLHEK